MNIHIKEIGPEGRHVQFTLDDAEVRRMLGLAEPDSASGSANIEVDIQLSRIQDTVLLSGRISGAVWTSCSRCLCPAEVAVDEPNLRHTFLPRTMFDDQVEPDQELSLEDLDTSTHDGETLDLSAVVRECLILALPMAPLCRDDCTGLEANGEGGAVEVPDWKQALKQLKSS